ncbi:MAG: TIGR02147 family protein, partial [Chitinispirillaceae bacterium]|nr:TIGR02147 family protein [Chitinispirillaceae bacterium]
LSSFLDFREYLKAVVDAARENGEPVTNRSFAKALGINSSSWLTNVLSGAKGITKETAHAISDYLGHDEWELRYFEILVHFNQAKTVEKRNGFFSDLKKHLLKKGYHTLHVLEPDQYEFYAKWYYTAVRSLLGMYSMGDEYNRIGRMTSPSITAVQAKKTIKLLTRLGLIKKNDAGRYELTGTSITTGTNVKSLAVANFQRETMRLGVEAIDRYPQPVRDISTMSVGISEQGYKKIAAILADCRKAIADTANNDQNADRVYQINFQAFPLSKIRNGGDK